MKTPCERCRLFKPALNDHLVPQPRKCCGTVSTATMQLVRVPGMPDDCPHAEKAEARVKKLEDAARLVCRVTHSDACGGGHPAAYEIASEALKKDGGEG